MILCGSYPFTLLTNQEVVLHSIRLLRFWLKEDRYILFDWLTVNTELTLTSSPFSRPIRSDKTKRQLLVIATDLVVHEEENRRNSSGRTFISHSFHYQSQSSEKRRFWLDPPPFLLHTTPQYHRGEEDNSGRAGRFIRLLIVKESQFYLTLPNAPASNSQPAAQLQ